MNHMSREVVTIGEFLVHLFQRSRGASFVIRVVGKEGEE